MTRIPCTGLDTEEAKHGIKDLAVTFFGTELKRADDGVHFTSLLTPKWLKKHVPTLGCAEVVAGGGDPIQVGDCPDEGS